MVQVHCENGDAVVYGQTKIFEMGITGPEGHPLSRPAVVSSNPIQLVSLNNVWSTKVNEGHADT